MRWLAGWSAATGHPWTISDEIVRIEALVSSRRFEYLLVEPGQVAFDAVTDLIAGDSRDVVTVFTNRPADYLIPHRALVTDRDDEALMTIVLAGQDVAAPDGYDLSWEDDGDRAFFHVMHEGELAASGNVALTGKDATYDRIETMPRHRRKGLGQFVMHSLTDWAIDNGADFGILAASLDGQHLYRSLGWKHECAMLMFRGTPELAA